MILSFIPEGIAKKQAVKFLKSKMPVAIEGLNDFLDKIFLQVAEECEENPFELFLLLSNQDGKLIGTVYNKEKKKLIFTDVGEAIEVLVQSGFNSSVPATFREMIEDFLAKEKITVTQLIIRELGKSQLIAKYNKESELIFIEIEGKRKERIDLSKILDKLKF